MTCRLCEKPAKNEFQLVELKDSYHLEAFSFLKGTSTDSVSLPKVCQACQEHVHVVAAIKSSAVLLSKNKEPTCSDQTPSGGNAQQGSDVTVEGTRRNGQGKLKDPESSINGKVECLGEDEDDEEQGCGDLDLDELDQLSLFYAEHEDEEDDEEDPSFVYAEAQVSKVSNKRPQGSSHRSSGKGRTSENRKVLPPKPPGNAILEKDGVFECKKCGRSFRRWTTFKSHCKHCKGSLLPHQEFDAFDTNANECQICRKSVPKDRMAAHMSFEHFCRMCSDESWDRCAVGKGPLALSGSSGLATQDKPMIFANRKEKCIHWQTVHRRSSGKGRRKASASVPCPREGCLRTFSKGSKKLKAHLKRDHDVPDSMKRTFECQECHALLKSKETLRSHFINQHAAAKNLIKCPYCDLKVRSSKKYFLYAKHMPAMHPDLPNNFLKEIDMERKKLWKVDFAVRCKIQCFLCDYAGVRLGHMKRHYTLLHNYDCSAAAASGAPDPDGALCPKCGTHFHNRSSLIQHHLKDHSVLGGEQCLYCPYRYPDILEHIALIHPKEKETQEQVCKKCGHKATGGFTDLLQHTRTVHRKTKASDFSSKGFRARKRNGATSSSAVVRATGGTESAEMHSRTIKEIGADKIEDDEEDDEEGSSKKGRGNRGYPAHLAGICPYCDYKFSDLLGHIRLVHEKDKDKEKSSAVEVGSGPKSCSKCQEVFESGRDLVSHRQLHPEFKKHVCTKCNAEFEMFVELRLHRANSCPKMKNKLRNRRNNTASASAASASVMASAASMTVSSSAAASGVSMKSGYASSLKAPTSANLLDSSTRGGSQKKLLQASSASSLVPQSNALSTLMLMAQELEGEGTKPKHIIEFEGRGTTKCHICSKTFTLKSLLRRHYIGHHKYNPKLASLNNSSPAKSHQYNESLSGGGLAEAESSIIPSSSSPSSSSTKEISSHCQACQRSFSNHHARIKHQLDQHSVLSGQICPYCDVKYGYRKFDHLDEHVEKHHRPEMLSPIQTCLSCKMSFDNYKALKVHRQLHEGGNRRATHVMVAGAVRSGSAGEGTVSCHTSVSIRPDVSNRGGVKCQLCTAFKLQKHQLKVHYMRHHGYDPKLAKILKAAAGEMAGRGGAGSGGHRDGGGNLDDDYCQFDEGEALIDCPCCAETFPENNLLIFHLLRKHSVYTGLICPYCTAANPQRYVDLQAHVTEKHMNMLTGYDVCNTCRVCKGQFGGYAELRDHVQSHGDMFKEPAPNKEQYKENARQKRQRLKLLRHKIKEEQRSQVAKKRAEETAAAIAKSTKVREEPEPEADLVGIDLIDAVSFDNNVGNASCVMNPLNFCEVVPHDFGCIKLENYRPQPVSVPSPVVFAADKVKQKDGLGENGDEEFEEGQEGIVVELGNGAMTSSSSNPFVHSGGPKLEGDGGGEVARKQQGRRQQQIFAGPIETNQIRPDSNGSLLTFITDPTPTRAQNPMLMQQASTAFGAQRQVPAAPPVAASCRLVDKEVVVGSLSSSAQSSQVPSSVSAPRPPLASSSSPFKVPQGHRQETVNKLGHGGTRSSPPSTLKAAAAATPPTKVQLDAHQETEASPESMDGTASTGVDFCSQRVRQDEEVLSPPFSVGALLAAAEIEDGEIGDAAASGEVQGQVNLGGTHGAGYSGCEMEVDLSSSSLNTPQMDVGTPLSNMCDQRSPMDMWQK